MTTLVIFNLITLILFFFFIIGAIMFLVGFFKRGEVADVIFNIGYRLFFTTTLLTIVNVYLTKYFCQ